MKKIASYVITLTLLSVITFNFIRNKNIEHSIRSLENKVTFLQYKIHSLEDSLNRKNNLIDSLQNVITSVYEFNKFLYDIGKKESNNNYFVVNKFGYLGKYQFSINTIKSLGYDIDSIKFLYNPILQERIMVANLKSNYGILSKHFDTITSGMLAASHLGGVGNVINGNIHLKDAYGTSIKEYLIEFDGYNLSFLKELN